MTNAALQVLEGQLAPYSQECEEAVLGAVLVESEVFPTLAVFLHAEDFYILRHQYLWTAFERITERREVIDFVTAQEELRAMNRLNDIGGAAYLLHLVNQTPAAARAPGYGRLVQRAAVRRRLLVAADEIKALAMDEQLTTEKVVADAEQRLLEVKGIQLSEQRESFAELVSRMMAEVEERMERPDVSIGVPTGFARLDELTSGGLRRGKLYIVAARPAMGKTSLLLTVALNAARLNHRVFVASQEMSRQEIVERFAAIETGINLQSIDMGRLTAQEWGRFVEASGKLGKLVMEVDDANRLTPLALRAKCLRWRDEHGLDLIVVDYLQILSSGGAFAPRERTAEVGYFAREMKQLAREFNVPVLCAAQLNRGLEDRQDKRPMLSDLRESGEIEQEADVVEFIYRDVVYNPATEHPNTAEIIIAKHRNGPTGTATLYFEKQTTRFSSALTETLDLSRL